MTQRPLEKEQVRMVVKNLQPVYQEKLMFQSINTFAELFDVETRIEDAIREDKIKKEEYQGGKPRRPLYGSNSHFGPTNVNALSQPEKRQNPFRVNGPSRPKQEGKYHIFSDLGISLTSAQDRLINKGH